MMKKKQNVQIEGEIAQRLMCSIGKENGQVEGEILSLK